MLIPTHPISEKLRDLPRRNENGERRVVVPSAQRRRSHSFNILHKLPEPETVTYNSNGKRVVSGGEPIDAQRLIPPSRTLELITSAQADKFIRSVQQERVRLSEQMRFLKKLWKDEFPTRFPALAGGAPQTGSQQGVDSNPASAAGSIIPFSQASKRGIEPGPSWSFTPGAAQQQLGPIGIPAQGYLRAVEIKVSTAAAGTGTGGEYKANAPFSLLSGVRFQDTNGNQLDDIPGYVLFLDNLYGGYSGCPDPRVDPDYEGTSVLKPAFQLGIWRELAPNGFGAIANMSASQAYKLTLKIGTESELYAKKPSEKNPELTIETFCHFWQLPQSEAMDGRKQVTIPPFHGTTQYRWWAPSNSVKQAFKLKIEQVGNEIRNLILVGENESKERKWGVFPEPLQLRWDTELLIIASQASLRKIVRELTNDQVNTPEGVLCLPWNYGEGRFVGGSGINSWLPTVTATRLEITGAQASSTPGEVGVYANDVSVAEVNPALRPATPGPGGYAPPVAPRLSGAQ